ncbi:MAG: tetratricopeptide repeat protein [Acidobacteriaceae bacterium]|jgi:outer membrane protein assembly factor BamD (BamD/ComL family)|nr:tetratricopeptide repeat protein [Acidobacteriaceae bacterium]
MAKQRPQPKSPASQASPLAGSGRVTPPLSKDLAAHTGPPQRAAHAEAVTLYEKGLAALQHHEYGQATEILRAVLSRYPDEKELHERVRLYLNVCERHVNRQGNAPATIEERLFAATVAINGGRYDEAISHLRLVRDEDPDNDHALYMLAVAHAQRGELTQALTLLERAIALNPENRALARRDPDLDLLREDDTFRDSVDPSSAPPTPPDLTPRRYIRPRTAR